jgi:uncharacterized peroxidase-related enzyme
VSFFKSIPGHGSPRTVFTTYPDLYHPWSEMSEVMMNGPSPLSQGERELILAFAAGVAGCEFVCVAHSEVAYQRGIERGLIEKLIANFATAPLSTKLRPLVAYVRKLSLTPGAMTQADADAVFAAGWDERSLHDAIAVTARAAFMQRLVEGYGFTPMTQDAAAKAAKGRIEHGYVNLFPEFRKDK